MKASEQALSWQEANRRYLEAAVVIVRQALERQARLPGSDNGTVSTELRQKEKENPWALDALCAAFDLSQFERNVLLLCAGMELEADFASLCGAAQSDSRHNYPTFGLAMAALPEADCNAISPSAPLRRWNLVWLGAGEVLNSRALHIDERVLHYLNGISCLDERLHGFIEPVDFCEEIPPSHRAVAKRVKELWPDINKFSSLPLIQLCGIDHEDKRAIAACACKSMNINLHCLRASDIPMAVAERNGLMRLWERESVLGRSALLVDCDDLVSMENLPGVISFLESVKTRLMVTCREPLGLRKRISIRFDVDKPNSGEQIALWRAALGREAPVLECYLDDIVAQFNLSQRGIRGASAEVLAGLEYNGGKGLESKIWQACRSQARPRMRDLAQLIEPASRGEDLVLPKGQKKILKEIAAQVKQRAKVYQTWGFASKGSRGLGISALFSGVSGTGKTMAAEVLANELRLDLYRIDLSQVVSKYIGETEKNLRRVFDAADEGGVILLFDEADALFGKRSEVKDSHDRYANVEISYLLQRMEEYRGLAILTTNMKKALDPAFLRRIRFVVDFPFPDAAQREQIWSRIFPQEIPRDGLDVEKLARLNVTGGNIRNIALYAAFLAAEAREPVSMEHLARAAKVEYSKLERALTEAEVGDWA